MIKFLFLICIIFLIIPVSQSQDKTDTTWSVLDFLLGNWSGTNSGAPGQGIGDFSFSFELDKNILVRKDHNVFPAHDGKPELVHDGLLIVYKDSSGLPMKGIYFDNENHVLNYDIQYPEINKKIIFLTEPNPGSIRFRLTFDKLDEDKVKVKFEAAMPNAPDNFKTHVEGIVTKVH